MMLRKSKLHKQQTKRNKRCGSLSQLCVILLFLLVVFYVTVASYLIPSSSNYKHRFDDDDIDHSFIRLVPVAPKIDSYKIPTPPQNKYEDKKYAPPLTKTHSNNIINNSLPQNDYSDLNKIEADYRAKCPEKFPKKIPEINELRYICSNLESFDVRYHASCSIETCAKCIPPTHTRMHTENEQTATYQKQFESEMESRRSTIKSMIGHLKPGMDGPIVLMVFNYGYAWLFYNFLCSLEYNDISIRNRSIIVTTDRESESLVKETGFNAFYPLWLGDSLLNRITSKAAASFALGGHKYIVSIQIALMNDLVHMGYDVVMQDIDMIWYQSPLPYLQNPLFKQIDIQMSVDGTMGLRGPGNSGFFIVRSNCKMKMFMDTMIKLVGLIMTGRSDQMLWNTLLQEKVFRMINFETLTTKHFISGFQVNIQHGTKRKDLPTNHFIVHASWTTDQWDKIEKFYNVQHWYFTPDKCPKWYKYELLPDLAERKWHIRDKTQAQEIKFKKLGFFRDSTNGSYAKHS